MANAIGEAFVTLRPDVSKFGAEAGNALAGSLSNVGSKFSSVGRLFTVAVTAPIVAGFGLSAKAAADFESAVADLENKVVGTPEQLQAIVKGARDMSRELPFSATEIVNTAKSAGQLGIATEDVLDFTRVVLQMAQTTGMSTEETATSVAKLTNLLNVAADDFDNFGSAVLAAGKMGASTEQEILDMSLRIAGVANVVGLTTPQVLAWGNAILNTGMEAEAGGTAISRAFVEMKNAVAGVALTKEETQALTNAQRAARDAADALTTSQHSLRNANETLQDSYRGVTQANRAVSDANDTLAQAYKDLARAQRDQTQASFDSRRETLSVAQAKQHLSEIEARGPALLLEQKEAQMAVVEATTRLNEARKKGNPQEIARAELSLQRAHQSLNELVVRQRGYTLELQSARLSVAETNAKVGTAQMAQNEKVAQSEKNVTSAVRGVEDAKYGQVKADRAVRDAREGVATAEKNVVKATEANADAQVKLNDVTESTTGKLQLFAKTAGMSVEEFTELFKRDANGAMIAFVNGLNRVEKEGGNVFEVLDKLGLGEIRVRDLFLRLMATQNSTRAGAVKLEDQMAGIAKAFEEGTELQDQSNRVNATTAAQLKILKNDMEDVAITFGQHLLPMIKGFAHEMEPFLGALHSAASMFGDLPAPVQTIIVVLGLLAAAIGPVLIVVGMLLTALPGLVILFPALATALPAMAAGFTALLGPIALVVAALVLLGVVIYLTIKHWDTIKEVATGAANAIKDTVVGAFNAVLDFMRNNWPVIATLISGPFAPIVALATDAFGVRSALEDAFNAVLGFLRDNWKEVGTLISGPFAPLVALATDAFGVRTALFNAFSGAAEWLYTAGYNVVMGFWNGMKSLAGQVLSWASNFASNVIGAVTGPLGLGSPSRVFHEMGMNTMKGFSNGLAAGFAPIPGQMNGYADQLSMTAGGWNEPKGGGIRGMTGGGGGGGGAVMAAVGGRYSESGLMGGTGVTVNNYGPIRATSGAGANKGLRNVGFGVASELQRRGVYAP